VESYRLDYPFQSGADTAVVSVRDDIQNVRAACEVPVNNRLHHSNRLVVPPVLETLDDPAGAQVLVTGGWDAVGCTGSFEGPCVEVSNPDGTAGPAVTPGTPFGQPRAFKVEQCDYTDPAGCGFAAGARWAQELPVQRNGLYRMSFYARPADLTTASLTDAASWVSVEEISGLGATAGTIHGWDGLSTSAFCEGYHECWETGTCAGTLPEDCADTFIDASGGDGWVRFWYYFRPSTNFARVAVLPTTSPTAAPQVWVAGLQLAALDGSEPSNAQPSAADLTAGNYIVDTPGDFAETGEELTHPVAICEDTEGKVFRSSSSGVWKYECVPVCLDGIGGCSENYLEPVCYWETKFAVSLNEIEERDIFSRAGFALGNFNYRTDTVAVNFVGTAARSCADDELPSTCYSAGFIPYTLVHEGPYPVRNHEGDEYEALIFQGKIEHARGLATERYLTNPLSSADRSQIEPYLQTQFRGRPMTGTYVLRVWDEPGVRFDGIEDVQLLWNYRFWTRFD
jgi:hypothetical protein